MKANGIIDFDLVFQNIINLNLDTDQLSEKGEIIRIEPSSVAGRLSEYVKFNLYAFFSWVPFLTFAPPLEPKSIQIINRTIKYLNNPATKTGIPIDPIEKQKKLSTFHEVIKKIEKIAEKNQVFNKQKIPALFRPFVPTLSLVDTKKLNNISSIIKNDWQNSSIYKRTEFVKTLGDIREVKLTAAEFLSAMESNFVEIDMYQGDIETSPEIFAPKEGTEKLRTQLSLLCNFWTLTNNYDAFTKGQKPEEKLTRDTFKELSTLNQKLAGSDDKKLRMLTVLAIHDLGKVVKLQTDIHMKGQDHDQVLLWYLENSPEKLPSFNALPPKEREKIIHSWKVRCSFSQSHQAESPSSQMEQGIQIVYDLINPVNFSAEAYPEDVEDLLFYLLHDLFDIGGAAGASISNPNIRIGSHGSVTLTENTVKTFLEFCKIILEPKDENESISEYAARKCKTYLNYRANVLGMNQRIELEDFVSVKILCMLRKYTPGSEKTFLNSYEIFKKANQKLCSVLEKNLDPDYKEAGMAYYAPFLMLSFDLTANTNLTEASLGLIGQVSTEEQKQQISDLKNDQKFCEKSYVLGLKILAKAFELAEDQGIEFSRIPNGQIFVGNIYKELTGVGKEKINAYLDGTEEVKLMFRKDSYQVVLAK